MPRHLPRFLVAALIAAGLAAGTALAQTGDETSRFVRFLEGLVSTPERQVAISGLEGAFSSNPTIARIVVSDQDGPWLTLDGVEMAWSRAALFRRVLDIAILEAQQVTMLRRPAAAAEPGAGGVSGLPVDLRIGDLNLPEIQLATPVVGAAARLSAEGAVQLSEGIFAARLAVERLDRAGALTADLRLEPDRNVLAANLKLSEPEGGLIADLLELRGRPALAIELSGAGPLDAWRAELAVTAAERRVLTGGVAISKAVAGHRITADLAGALEDIAPEDYASLLSGESRLAFNVLRGPDGGLSVESASLFSAGMELAGSFALAADLAPLRADLTVRLGQAGRTILPFMPGAASVARLDATLGLDAGADAPWRAEIAAEGLQSDLGRVGGLALTARGRASNLADPEERGVSFQLDGSAQGVAAADAALAQALGPSLRLTGSGAWAAGRPVTFETLQMVLTGASLSFAGTAAADELKGRFGASVTDLARLGGLAGRPLAGSAEWQATGSVLPLARGFDLDLDGRATDLRLGFPAIDPLLAGATTIRGGVARAEGNFVFDDLALANAHATAELAGSYAADAIDLALAGSVANLASLTPRAQGRAELSARLSGTPTEPEVTATASGDGVVLMGRALAEPSARFSGVVAGPRTGGEATIAGRLGDVPVQGSARLVPGEDGARRLDDLLLTVGASRAAGELAIGGDGLIDGAVTVVSPDLSQVAPLFLAEAGGMLKAEVTLRPTNGGQSAEIAAAATDLVYEGVTLRSADLSGRIDDLFAAPRLGGTFALRELRAGGLAVVAAEGTAVRQGQSTSVAMTAEVAGGNARLEGSLEPRGGAIAVSVQALAFRRAGLDVSLAAPAAISIRDGAASFGPTTLNAGGGTVTLGGSAGQALDMTARLSGVPASLANAVMPELAAEGVVAGTVTVTGAASDPSARFDLAWQEASVAASRGAGLGPLAITAQGGLAKGVVELQSRIAGAEGLALQAAGRIGTAPGASLDLRVTGTAPLALGNAQLVSRGASAQGALNVDIAVTGTASAPLFAGRVTSEGGGFVDPQTGIVLTDLSLAAALDGDRLTIERLTARSGEGTISAAGSIGLAGGFPVDVTARIRQARYVDGAHVATRFDADLTLSGSLSAGPVLGGEVFLDRTEITVPESLPRDSVAVDVEHVGAPPPVQATLGLARGDGGGREGGGGASGLAVSLRINAPQQIFVRGRGLDAELGGSLRLTGALSALVADGAFEMRRGRLDIFTQRLTFDRGVVTFAGDLDPVLDFSGSTVSGDVTVTVTVAGEASDPEITFSSVPELPQDEVLAYLIFERGVAELSPVQMARLADAAAGLGGGGGLLNRLRASTGLDDLDVVTDAQGAPAVAAGRYISENVYIGVQQGASTESSRVTIDLDITDDVKARGAVTPQGDSSLGVFFEREY